MTSINIFLVNKTIRKKISIHKFRNSVSYIKKLCANVHPLRGMLIGTQYETEWGTLALLVIWHIIIQ